MKKGKKGKKVGKAIVMKKKQNKTELSQYNQTLACLLLDNVEEVILKNETSIEYADKLCYQLVKLKKDENGKVIKDENGNNIKEVVGQDLVAQGYRELARFLAPKIGRIQLGEPKEHYLENQRQWVVRIEGKNIKTGENAWGGAEVKGYFEKDGTVKPYEFAYRAALTKAERNVLKKLIPLEPRLRIIKRWIKQGKVIEVPYEKQKALQLSDSIAKMDNSKRGIYAKLKELKIDAKKWHEYILIDNEVESINDLGVDGLDKLYKKLSSLVGKNDELVIYMDNINTTLHIGKQKVNKEE